MEETKKKKSLGKFEYKGEFYTLKELSEISKELGSNLSRESIRKRYTDYDLRDDDLLAKKGTVDLQPKIKARKIIIRNQKHTLIE